MKIRPPSPVEAVAVTLASAAVTKLVLAIHNAPSAPNTEGGFHVSVYRPTEPSPMGLVFSSNHVGWLVSGGLYGVGIAIGHFRLDAVPGRVASASWWLAKRLEALVDALDGLTHDADAFANSWIERLASTLPESQVIRYTPPAAPAHGLFQGLGVTYAEGGAINFPHLSDLEASFRRQYGAERPEGN